MQAPSELNHPIGPFGYRVDRLEPTLTPLDRAFLAELQEAHGGDIGLINAVGDGNCGPRAVIQSLLIRGVAGGAQMQQDVLAYLQHTLYNSHNTQLDSRGRSLYGCILRRQDALRESDLRDHRNSCALVGNVLHYIDFDGQTTTFNINDMPAFEQTINPIAGFRTFAELGVDTPSTVRLTYAELNQLTGGNPRIDHTDRIQAMVQAFLTNYRTMQPNQLAQLREDYLGHTDPYRRAIHDDIIYVLAGCLRFDITAYARLPNPEDHLVGGSLSSEIGGVTHDQALQWLGQLERDIDFNDTVGYFSDHRIHCTLDGAPRSGVAKDRLVNPDLLIPILNNSDRFERQPRPIDISIYRSGAHFMSLLFEQRDRALLPQALSPRPAPSSNEHPLELSNMFGEIQFGSDDSSAFRNESNTAADSLLIDPLLNSIIPPVPVPSVSREATFTGRAEFEAQLELIKNKADQLGADGHDVAADVALALYASIIENAKKFFALDISEHAFKKSCADAINIARPVLDAFGWKEILGNLALAILGLGVVYAAACLINKAVTGHFLFFRMDASQKIDRLEDKIMDVALAAPAA